MSSQNISINPEQAAASVNLVAEGQEKVVDLGSVVQSHGANVGPTASFKSTLNTYVQDMQDAMNLIEAKLRVVREGINNTVIDLGEKDASLAEETQTFLAGVEGVPSPDASSTGTSSAESGTSTTKSF